MFIDPTFSLSVSFFIGVGSCCTRLALVGGGVVVGSKLAVEGGRFVAGMGSGKSSGTEDCLVVGNGRMAVGLEPLPSPFPCLPLAPSEFLLSSTS